MGLFSVLKAIVHWAGAFPRENVPEDGRTMIAWGNQVLDIPDHFLDGVCYVKLANGDETRYITAHEGQGFSMSPCKFLKPTTF